MARNKSSKDGKSKKSSPQDILKKMSLSSAPAKAGNEMPKSTEDKINDLLFHMDKIKNGISISTGDHEALTRIYSGQKMYVDTRDISLAPHILLDGIWEPNITKIIDSLVNPGDVMIDVGANFGYFSLIAGRFMKQDQGAHIYLIEANPIFTPYLRKSLNINGLLDFSTISNIAVSDKDDTITLNMLEDIWGSSSIHTEKQLQDRMTIDIKVEDEIQIEATSLDKYADEHNIKAANIIKMDIEGYEEVAYRGMPKLIKNSPELIMLLEFTTEGYDHPKKFFDKLSSDFEYVYGVAPDAPHLELLSDYKDIARVSDDEWIMLVLSKKPLQLSFE